MINKIKNENLNDLLQLFLWLIINLFFLYLFLKVVDISHYGTLKLGELLLFSIIAKFASRSFG